MNTHYINKDCFVRILRINCSKRRGSMHISEDVDVADATADVTIVLVTLNYDNEDDCFSS